MGRAVHRYSVSPVRPTRRRTDAAILRLIEYVPGCFSDLYEKSGEPPGSFVTADPLERPYGEGKRRGLETAVLVQVS